MSAGRGGGAAVTASVGGGEAARLQLRGRTLVLALYTAVQSLRLYPLENETVQKALRELQSGAEKLLHEEGVISLRLAEGFVFMNDARLRMELASYGAFSYMTSLLGRHGIGQVEVGPGVGVGEWAPFLSLLLREDGSETEESPYLRFVQRLQESPVEHIGVGTEQSAPETDEQDSEDAAKEAAKRTYAQTVQVARQVLSDTRLGRAVNVRRVKRAVQSIVDQVLGNEQLMLGMTTLRDFDEYTYTHCVNVCIFSVTIGQKLGLSRMQLYELGMGALFHDVGKERVGEDVVKKPGGLTDEEWRRMQRHPTEGMLALFTMHGFSDSPWRSMLMAYEHHMKVDLTGYPENRRPRSPTLFSRIVAVADGFEAGTARRVYQQEPPRPELVLQEMRDNPRRGFDPLLVKALINVTGIFPVGTLVILDTHELAVVVAANPVAERIHQPVVKIIADGMGMPLAKPLLVDLSVPAEDGTPRSIIKTTDPVKYGIRIGDYFS